MASATLHHTSLDASQLPHSADRTAPRSSLSGKSQKSASMTPTKNLVFMNFTNPASDIRNPEIRRTIARTAMINRPRPREQHPSSTLPLHPSQTSTSTTSQPAVNPARLRQQSTVDSQYSTSPPIASPGWTTSSGSPPTADQLDLLNDPNYTNGYFDLSSMTIPDPSNIDEFNAFLASTLLPSQINTQPQHLLANDVEGANRIPPSNPDEKRRKQKKKESRNTKSNALVTQPKGKRGQAQPNFHIIGAATDPFDCLPIKADPHTHELIYQYLQAQLVSKVFARPGSQVLERLKRARDGVWWPLTRNSKAALAALIAYVEATPDLKNKARSDSFMQKHLDVAMAAVTEALKNGTEHDDSICFAIVLLMITAQRLGDNEIFAMHTKMLTQILSQRARTTSQSRQIEDATNQRRLRFHAPDNGTQSQRCLYCRDIKDTVDASTDSNPSSPEEAVEEIHRQSYDNKGLGFFELIRCGILSSSMQGFIEQVLQWNQIAGLARLDRLSAASAASHAWVDGSPVKEAKTHFDAAVMFATRICLYLSAWLDWNHSCDAVRSMLGAVYEGLKSSDLETLLQTAPDAILWLALLAGPYSEGEARPFFEKLLVDARIATNMHDFDATLLHISEKFIFSPTMIPGSLKFFYDGMSLRPMYM